MLFSISYRLKNSWNNASRSAGEICKPEPAARRVSGGGAAGDRGFVGFALVVGELDAEMVGSTGGSGIPKDNVCWTPAVKRESHDGSEPPFGGGCSFGNPVGSVVIFVVSKNQHLRLWPRSV